MRKGRLQLEGQGQGLDSFQDAPPWHGAAFREDGSEDASAGFILKLHQEIFILPERARGNRALAEKASALGSEGVRHSGQGPGGPVPHSCFRFVWEIQTRTCKDVPLCLYRVRA